METVRDIMRKSVVAQAKPVDLFLKREFSRKQYQSQKRFAYCPRCYQQIKRAGLDYKKELKPLWVYTFKCLYKVDANSGFVAYEKFYKCERCMKGKDDFLSEDELISEWIERGAAARTQTALVDLNDKAALERF